MDCVNGHEFDGTGRVIMEGKHKGKIVCRQCDRGKAPVLPGPSLFPFTTTNLAGRPGVEISVQSLRHLRKLETQFGVQSHAFNNEERHWNDPASKRM
jgi:hypothetical protein